MPTFLQCGVLLPYCMQKWGNAGMQFQLFRPKQGRGANFSPMQRYENTGIRGAYSAPPPMQEMPGMRGCGANFSL